MADEDQTLPLELAALERRVQEAVKGASADDVALIGMYLASSAAAILKAHADQGCAGCAGSLRDLLRATLPSLNVTLLELHGISADALRADAAPADDTPTTKSSHLH